MAWSFFPFTLLKRAKAADTASHTEQTFYPTEQYVSQLTQLPLPVVASIYRAGRPWPVALDDFDRVAQQEANDLNISLDQARLIVMKRLQWQKANAENGGKPMDLEAYKTWHNHRERIARRLRAEMALVTQVHHGVLKYHWQEGKKPD
jgi:hypothetical protein